MKNLNYILVVAVLVLGYLYITKPTYKKEVDLLKGELLQKQQTYEREFDSLQKLRQIDVAKYQEQLQQNKAEHAAQLLKIQNDDKAKDHYFSSDYDERFNVFSETYNPKD